MTARQNRWLPASGIQSLVPSIGQACYNKTNLRRTRTELDQLLAKQATYGRLDYADQTKARQSIETMFAGLKSQIKDVPPQDWVASQSFLKSLNYAVTKTEID